MDIRTEIQVKAVKSPRAVTVMRFKDFVFFADGIRGIYVSNEAVVTDLGKLPRYEGTFKDEIDPEKILSGTEPSELAEECLVKKDTLYRKLRGKESGTEVWVKQSALRGFEDCGYFIKGRKSPVAATDTDGILCGAIMPVIFEKK